MPYRELIPPLALRPFVDRFWVQAGPTEGQILRVLPDGCIDILVDLDSGRHAVVGTMTRSLVFQLRPAARTAAVRFRPGGATPFLRTPAHELTDRTVEGDDVGGLGWVGAEEIAAAGDLKDAARRLERAMLGRLPRAGAPRPELARAARALFGAAPPSVAALARELGCTRQHLGRLFREHIGVTPKGLARVARLQRAVASLQQDPTATMARIAADAGYFDEAHMDRDFRALAGVTPGSARVGAGSIRPIRSLLEGV